MQFTRKSAWRARNHSIALLAIFCLLCGMPDAHAARRGNQPYTRADAGYVTTSMDPARLDFIICVEGIAGNAVPGGDIEHALQEAAFACGAWANRMQPRRGEPDAFEIFDMIRECGFRPGDASPGADCGGGSSASSVPSQPGIVPSSGGDGPVTRFTLIQDLPVPVTVSWIGYDGVEHIAGGGQFVRPGGAWKVENGARGYESHWYSIRAGNQVLCSIALRQNAVVRLSQLSACRMQAGMGPQVQNNQNQFNQGTAPVHNGGGGEWWVVVGSEPNPNNDDTGPANARVNDMLAPCRIEAFTDWSAKWSGFRPGLSVSVLGGYASKGEADQVRRAISACIPDAYVKRGAYAGE